MKKWIQKIILTILCLASFVMAGIRIYAEEGDGNEIIHSRFYVLTVQETRELEVPFNRNWFKESAAVYSHDLAKLSLGLATAAFRPGGVDEKTEETMDVNLASFLREAHFTDLRSDDYDKNPSMYTISTVMGHQKIGEGDDAFELIAVGVCGQGYRDEWESNFTIGNSTFHEGFDRSARLVYDRIFGYIAREHLEGHCKIWISGFSRAAAVSNLTAARLVDSDMFETEDVFAYTFATPRTNRDDNFYRYPNIFNIVGKTDPVPNVPFADWGYRRYGNTLYLPVPQTDSDYYVKREKANIVYKQLTGIDYWYNQESDVMLKNILSYCLQLCPSVDVYTGSLQEKLIRIWEGKTLPNIMMNLLELANDPVLINEETKDYANMLLNYLTGFLLSFLSESSVFRRWNPNASLGANFMQAHTPELYVSWMFSGDASLFTGSSSYSLISLDTDAEISLLSGDKVIETIEPVCAAEDDYYTHSIAYAAAETPEGNRYLVYGESSVLLTLPRDSEYTVRFDAPDADCVIHAVQLDYSIENQNPVKTYGTTCLLHQGETLSCTLQKDGEPVFEPKEKTESDDFSYNDDLDYTVIEAISTTKPTATQWAWRDAAITFLSIGFILIALLFFQITYMIGKIRFHSRIRKGWLPEGSSYPKAPLFCVWMIILLFLIKEFFTALYPLNTRMALNFKLAIGMLSLTASAIGHVRHKDRLSGWIMAAIIILAGADLVTTLNMVIGAFMHIAAYIMMAYVFVSEERPEKRQIIVWAIMSVIGIGILMTIKGEYGMLRIMAILYLSAALFMVTASFQMPRRVFAGAVLLFAAGCLLMYNVINGQTFLTHMLSLGTYYAAICVLASSSSRIVIPRLVPEDRLHTQA